MPTVATVPEATSWLNDNVLQPFLEETRQEKIEENPGYDVTSLDLESGELRLIEVKGLAAHRSRGTGGRHRADDAGANQRPGPLSVARGDQGRPLLAGSKCDVPSNEGKGGSAALRKKGSRMKKPVANHYRLFISSVQKEFEAERRAIKDFVHNDPLLRRFFDVFLFEDLPASDRPAKGTGPPQFAGQG